jgi:5-methylcytosine-specific restriction endonuclease McrA
MPIVKLCTHPRCGRYRTEGRHCAEHAKVWRAKDSARRNTHPRKRIYSDPRWPKVRRAVLHRDDHTCQHCGHYDPTGRGLVCDHIHGALTPGVDPFNAELCQTLCRRCSGRKDGARSHTHRFNGG